MSRQGNSPVTITCAWCQTTFQVAWHQRGRRFCSKKCSCANAGAGNKPVRITITCLHCERAFKVTPFFKNRRKFCSPSCATLWQASQPEWRQRYTDTMREKVSTAAKKRYASDHGKKTRQMLSERMTRDNPMHHQDAVERMRETKGRRGTLHNGPSERGGNGKLTPQQVKLKDTLGDRWETELPIPTRRPRGNGYPTCYKVDVGNLKAKVAVEIDGKMHRNKKVREKDHKKQNLLVSLGWTVLRFSNQEIDTDVNAVAAIINGSTA